MPHALYSLSGLRSKRKPARWPREVPGGRIIGECGEIEKRQRMTDILCRAEEYYSVPDHQTRQRFSRTMGWPALQLKAFWNSGMLITSPFTRYFPGECGLVMALARRFSGRSFSHAHCA